MKMGRLATMKTTPSVAGLAVPTRHSSSHARRAPATPCPPRRSRALPIQSLSQSVGEAPAANPTGVAPPTWPTTAARHTAFSSVSPETVDGVQAQVSGTIPSWLSGSYMRNGPGTYENGAPGGQVHMFDGFALLAKFAVDGANNRVLASHR
jgi:carlactone synthase / all-trans-10'-apo-beta-carotenal 13,14-cleaving dioxygenase